MLTSGSHRRLSQVMFELDVDLGGRRVGPYTKKSEEMN